MRKIKKINGFLVVKFNDREKREYEGTALGEYGVIDAEVYTGNLDIDRGAMEYDDADTLEVAVELARGLESEEDITDEPPTYTAAVETNESYTEESVEPTALIEGWTRRLATQVKSKHYPDTDPRTAAHELYGFKMALHQIGFLSESEVITDPDTFGAGRLDGPMPRNPEELLAFVCDERCKNRAGHTQEELDAICAKCPLGQLYEDAEAQDLRIRERSERALREHIEGVRHAEDTLTALLGGHEALAYLAALRDGQILQENECEHYAAQIAEAGAAWETVLEGVSFEDLSRLRHLLREVDEYTKGGGELFNGFQHETERIPAHRLEELHQLGTALLGECPENDCTIYRNVFRMAVDVDGQMGKLTGHARETMQREYPEAVAAKYGQYNFTVAHMVAMADCGLDVGTVEFPAVTKTASGLLVTLTGLSPVAISWTESTNHYYYNPTATPDKTDSANTADDSQMVLWLGSAVLAAAAVVVLTRKKRVSK